MTIWVGFFQATGMLLPTANHGTSCRRRWVGSNNLQCLHPVCIHGLPKLTKFSQKWLEVSTSEFGTGLCLSVNRLARVSLTPKKLPTSPPKKSHMVHFQTCQALCKVHHRLAFARWVHGRISTILDFPMWKTFWVAVLWCKAAVMQCMQCLPCKRCTWNDCSEVYSCLLSLTIPLWAGLNINIYIYSIYTSIYIYILYYTSIWIECFVMAMFSVTDKTLNWLEVSFNFNLGVYFTRCGWRYHADDQKTSLTWRFQSCRNPGFRMLEASRGQTKGLT